MKKIFVTAVCCFLMVSFLKAQSKVFKEISDDISTSMEAIVQDGALMGYVAFTKLEKANADSFNYKVTIMDENLNDIGTVNFREENLELQAVAFEQDILCLAYVKSTLKGQEFKTNKAFNSAKENAKNAVITQFLNLDGKIVKQNSFPVSVGAGANDKYYTSYSKFVINTSLKHNIELINIPQKGFVCNFGDDYKNWVIAYTADGTELWKKNVDDAKYYSLLATADNIYMLTKKALKDFDEGGYTVQGYAVADGSSNINYTLEDKEGAPLKVLGFGTDLNTGKPFIAGNIINKKKGKRYDTGKGVASGAYTGVFTLNINGNKNADIKELFSYWSDGSQIPSISQKGKLEESGSYPLFSRAIRDFEGNTYFTGSSFVKRIKWGTIGFSILCAPLIIVSPIILGAGGTQKCKVRDGVILKQSAKGVLSFENSIEGNSSGFRPARMWHYLYNNKKFYSVSNSGTKTNYIIMDDEKDIVIYNINKKKVVRKISHKDGKSRINIYPAKEGHIMVSEYNKKEKYTRMSIEAL